MSKRKIVPVWSDDSMYDATPVRDPFFRNMEEYERRKTLKLSRPIVYSPVNNGYESSSISSETSHEYNQRIKRENSCVKCCSFLSFLGCLVGISMA